MACDYVFTADVQRCTPAALRARPGAQSQCGGRGRARHFFEALARAEAVKIVAQAHTRPGQLAQALQGSVRTPQVGWGGHVPALAQCARVIWGKY